MAAPNIVGLTNIVGVTTMGTLTANFTTLVSNSASSNQAYKINSILISNIDGINNADVTIGINNAANGAGAATYHFAKTLTVPADSSLVVLGKDAPIYLEENRSIIGKASSIDDLDFIISYEVIS